MLRRAGSTWSRASRRSERKSFQFWLRPTPEQKEWQDRYRIMTDVYENPFNSVADMSQTLAFETWPAGERPGSVIYSSTAMPDDPHEPPKPNDTYQTKQNEEVEKAADRGSATSRAASSAGSAISTIPAAYGERYHRANVSADQRYTLSVAGSAKARLAPDGSGFENLFLAGDWTQSPLNLGCAEGATMSGMLAGRGVLRATAATGASNRDGGKGARASCDDCARVVPERGCGRALHRSPGHARLPPCLPPERHHALSVRARCEPRRR